MSVCLFARQLKGVLRSPICMKKSPEAFRLRGILLGGRIQDRTCDTRTSSGCLYQPEQSSALDYCKPHRTVCQELLYSARKFYEKLVEILEIRVVFLPIAGSIYDPRLAERLDCQLRRVYRLVENLGKARDLVAFHQVNPLPNRIGAVALYRRKEMEFALFTIPTWSQSPLWSQSK